MVKLGEPHEEKMIMDGDGTTDAKNRIYASYRIPRGEYVLHLPDYENVPNVGVTVDESGKFVLPSLVRNVLKNIYDTEPSETEIHFEIRKVADTEVSNE